MGVVEERKALDRVAEAYRRIVAGAREATRPTPPPEEEETPPGPPAASQAGPQTPSTQ